MTRTSQMLFTLLCCVIACTAISEEPQPLAVIDGVLELLDDGQAVVLRVDTIYQLDRGKQHSVKQLTLHCPVDDRYAWKLVLKEGQVYPLEWSSEGGKRGFLFFGGAGGSAKLRVPSVGWTGRCTCEEKKVPEDMPIYILFVDSTEGAMEEMKLQGASEKWYQRFLPFVFKGQTPHPPKRVRVKLFWQPPATLEG